MEAQYHEMLYLYIQMILERLYFRMQVMLQRNQWDSNVSPAIEKYV